MGVCAIEETVNDFIRKAFALFEGTDVRFWEHDKTTEQVFLKVGPLFSETHRSAIEAYLQTKHPRLLVSIIRDETVPDPRVGDS